MKKFAGIGLAVALVAIVAAFSFSGGKSGLLYKPFHKGNAEMDEAQEIAGAVQHYAMLRNNLATGMLNSEDVYSMYRSMDMMRSPMNKTATPMNWISMGPDNQGGRTLAILVDKDSSNIVYAGAASGGLWRSKNGGGSWQIVSSGMVNQAVNTIAQTDDGNIYFGTGENFYAAPGGSGNEQTGVIGRGIFMFNPSTGVVTSLTKTDPANSGGAYTGGNTWDFVHKIVVGLNNTLYAGTNNGLWYSTDLGKTWTRFGSSDGIKIALSRGMDLAITPDRSTIYAVMQGPNYDYTEYYRSTDGKTWKHIAVGKMSSVSRALIAVSYSNPSTVYISAAKLDRTLYGIFRSDDNGDTWTTAKSGGSPYDDPFVQEPNGKNAQGSYDNCIVVDPGNPNRVFVGGVHLYTGIFDVTSGLWSWSLGASLSGGNYVHADKHCFALDTRSPYVLYIGCDGGIFKSTNNINSTATTIGNPPSFKAVNAGYITTQFYAVAASPVNKNQAIGGTQDNGTMLVNNLGESRLRGTEVYGGDGFYTAYSHLDTRISFVETYYAQFARSLDGQTYNSFADKNITSGDRNLFAFSTPLRLWEQEKIDTLKDTAGKPVIDTITHKVIRNFDMHNSKFFVGGNAGLYCTTGALDFQNSPVFFKLASYSMYTVCMEYTPDGNTVYIGGIAGSTGVLYRVSGLDKFRQWAFKAGGVFNPSDYGIKITQLRTFGNQTVTGIGVDHNNGGNIVVTLGNYGTSDHVMLATAADDISGTGNWTNISGNLNTLNFPVYDAEIDIKNPNRVVLATEMGVWTTDNAYASSVTWTEQNSGLERVPCFMVIQDTLNRVGTGSIYYVASHRRGIFRSEDGFRVGIDQPVAQSVAPATVSIYPNPANDMTNLNFNIGSRTDINVEIYDLSGREIKNYSLGEQMPGIHNLQVVTEGYKPGTYIIHAHGRGFDKTAKLLVVR